MAQWEYRKIDLNDLPRKADDIDVLSDAGEQGWELVILSNNNIAYLKRQIAATSPPGSVPRKTTAVSPRTK